MDIKALQKSFTLISAIVGIVTFVASVIYNYYFFMNLGMNFSQIPISFSDITQTFLYWLPYSLFYLIVSFALVWLYDPTRFIGSTNTNNDSTCYMAPINFVVKALPWIILSNFIIYLLAGDISKRAEINAIVLFSMLVILKVSEKAPIFLLKFSIIQQNDIRKTSLLLYYPISFLIIIGFIGYSDSQKLRDINPPSTTILVNSQQIKSNIIRTLDKGIVIGIKDSPIDFIPWTAVSDIRTVIIHDKFKGIMCEWFGKCRPYKLISQKK